MRNRYDYRVEGEVCVRTMPCYTKVYSKLLHTEHVPQSQQLRAPGEAPLPFAPHAPVNNPEAVQVLHALANLQQRRPQLRGRADVLRRQRSDEAYPWSTGSALVVLGFSATLGLRAGTQGHPGGTTGVGGGCSGADGKKTRRDRGTVKQI